MMSSFKFQVTTLLIIPLLLLFIVVLGCELNIEKPSREGTGDMAIIIEMDAEDAPESHRGTVEAPPKVAFLAKIFKSGLKDIDYWRAYHPDLTTWKRLPAIGGITDPQFIYKDEEGEFVLCLDCHTAETSCNNCHQYVGVKFVSGEEE